MKVDGRVYLATLPTVHPAGAVHATCPTAGESPGDPSMCQRQASQVSWAVLPHMGSREVPVFYLNAPLPSTVCVCPVTQMSAQIPGTRKISAFCTKSVTLGKPWWPWTLATPRPHNATRTQPLPLEPGLGIEHGASLHTKCKGAWEL